MYKQILVASFYKIILPFVCLLAEEPAAFANAPTHGALQMSIVKPLIVDWEGLLRMGHPFSRTHTIRKMSSSITVTRKTKNGGVEKRVIPNPDPFPKCVKLGTHKNSPIVWRVAEVLAYYESHGLPVKEDWQASE